MPPPPEMPPSEQRHVRGRMNMLLRIPRERRPRALGLRVHQVFVREIALDGSAFVDLPQDGSLEFPFVVIVVPFQRIGAESVPVHPAVAIRGRLESILYFVRTQKISLTVVMGHFWVRLSIEPPIRILPRCLRILWRAVPGRRRRRRRGRSSTANGTGRLPLALVCSVS